MFSLFIILLLSKAFCIIWIILARLMMLVILALKGIVYVYTL